jgi:hypothetical protein
MRGKELAEEELERIAEEQRKAEEEAKKEAEKMPDSYYDELSKQINI